MSASLHFSRPIFGESAIRAPRKAAMTAVTSKPNILMCSRSVTQSTITKPKIAIAFFSPALTGPISFSFSRRLSSPPLTTGRFCSGRSLKMIHGPMNQLMSMARITTGRLAKSQSV